MDSVYDNIFLIWHGELKQLKNWFYYVKNSNGDYIYE